MRSVSTQHPYRTGDRVKLVKSDKYECTIPLGTEGIVRHPGDYFPYVSWYGLPDAVEGGWPMDPACLALIC